MARTSAGRSPARRLAGTGALFAGVALAAAIGACGDPAGTVGPTPTLDPLSVRLVEWYDPVALAADHEWGRGCVAVARSGEPRATEAHLLWVVDCPREPGDRTIYFLLEEDTRAAIEEAGGRIGSGSGQGDADQGLLSDYWRFSMPGATGVGRITSTDVGDTQLRILVTIDLIAG